MDDGFRPAFWIVGIEVGTSWLVFAGIDAFKLADDMGDVGVVFWMIEVLVALVGDERIQGLLDLMA
ncbi:MAG: hypothetical protein HQL45_09280 [Alphaproteobacteria bacterium]|nr:hypothetical protein [Alphaproteobacteria bacterium]